MELTHAFAVLDSNKNGYLSVRELFGNGSGDREVLSESDVSGLGNMESWPLTNILDKLMESQRRRNVGYYSIGGKIFGV